MQKILLLGASMESDNRGVNALAIGAITVLLKKMPDAKITLLTVGETRKVQKTVYLEDREVEVELCYFSKYDFGKSMIGSLIYRLFGFKLVSDISCLILESDLVFDINEGDSFSDIYGSRRIIRHYFDSKLILSWGKPLVFLPQTIGPFNTKMGRILSKNILKNLSKLYVRDTKAFNYLDSIPVNYELAIDMAVYMHPSPINKVILPNTIGININGLMYFNRYGSMKGQYDSYRKFIKQMTELFILKGFKILLIPHTYNSINPNEEDDLQAIKSFVSENQDLSSSIEYIDENYNAQEMKHIFSQMEFFIGSRMHSCIGALSKSVPTIGLAYSYKFEGTFKMFSMEDHVFSLKKLNTKEIQPILSKILLCVEQRHNTRKVLEKLNNRKVLEI